MHMWYKAKPLHYQLLPNRLSNTNKDKPTSRTVWQSSMYLQCMCVCVGRVLPVTHRGSLASRNAAQKQSGKPRVGVELPKLHGTRQDRTEWNVGGQESGVCEATGSCHVFSRNCALLDDTNVSHTNTSYQPPRTCRGKWMLMVTKAQDKWGKSLVTQKEKPRNSQHWPSQPGSSPGSFPASPTLQPQILNTTHVCRQSHQARCFCGQERKNSSCSHLPALSWVTFVYQTHTESLPTEWLREVSRSQPLLCHRFSAYTKVQSSHVVQVIQY